MLMMSLLQQTTQAAQPSLLQQAQALFLSFTKLDPMQAALRGGLTILVFIGAALVMWGLHVALDALTERLFPGTSEAPQGKRKGQHTPVGRLSLTIVRISVFIAAVLISLRIWGLDLGVLTQGPVGAVLNVVGHVVLIVVLALVAMEVAQVAVIQLFARIAVRARTPRRASQLRTLGPLIVGVINTAFIVVAVMMALSQVGVQIGPLLAGAGIVGVAVGFGAQTLVKDFLTGIFLIIEDTVSVGDVANIGGFGGLVEEMSLRTIKLRDHDGTLHVLPYSEAQVIHNLTKNFSYYVLNLSISYGSDIVKALELMKSVADEMREDPRFAVSMLEPIDIAGVDALADSGVVLKARIKTLPIKQWEVGREYLKRIKLAFDANNVEIPFPHMKLVAPDDPITLLDDAHAQHRGRDSTVR
jgi:small conductance mechanosensitive channel